MDETLIPNSSPFNTAPGRGNGPIVIILMIVLGVAAIIFAILALTFSTATTKATKTLNAQKAQAAAQAAADQKIQDEVIHTKADESPYREYSAPVEFGSFVISFPKNWSSYVDQEPSGKQVSLALNPVHVRRTNGVDEAMAARVTLQERTKDQYLAQYAGAVKSKSMTQSATTVSGQPAFIFTGKFPDRKTIREVVVPIRDKVLTFSTENAAYSAEFGLIVSGSKIIP